MAFESSRGFPLGSSRLSRQFVLRALGRWDEVLSQGGDLIALAAPLGNRFAADSAAVSMALVLTRRGMATAAVELARTGELGIERPFHLARIACHRSRHELGEAERLLVDVVGRTAAEGIDPDDYSDACDLARESVALGRSDLLELLGSVLGGEMAAYRHTRATLAAITAEAEGRHEEALGVFGDATLRVGARTRGQCSGAARRGAGALRRSRCLACARGDRQTPAAGGSGRLIDRDPEMGPPHGQRPYLAVTRGVDRSPDKGGAVPLRGFPCEVRTRTTTAESR
jgi:hypothetical protein